MGDFLLARLVRVGRAAAFLGLFTMPVGGYNRNKESMLLCMFHVLLWRHRRYD